MIILVLFLLNMRSNFLEKSDLIVVFIYCYNDETYTYYFLIGVIKICVKCGLTTYIPIEFG